MKRESDEKNERIFQVAKELFAMQGYHQTSANSIAEKADVSKALVFHHYKSKKALYLAIIEHSIDSMMATFNKEWEPLESNDFFEQMKGFVKAKLTVALKHPKENKLMIQAFHSPPKEAVNELQLVFQVKSKAMQSLNDEYIFNCLTPQSIREGVEMNQAKTLIRTVFEGFSQRILADYSGKYEEIVHDSDRILSEMDAIIEILKYGVIKKS